MSILDILILIVLFGGLAYGFHKGLVSQLGSLSGVIIGVIVCQLIGGTVADFAQQVFSPSYTTRVVSVILLFIIVYVAVRLVAKLINKVFKVLHLKALDRIAGALFVAFKWMLVLSFLLNLYATFFTAGNIQAESSLANGNVIQAVLDLAPNTLGWVRDTATTATDATLSACL